MNKYELVVVVNAVIEDDARAAVIEKAKDLITRFGGTISGVDEWGKKRLAYEIQKMNDGFYYFINLRQRLQQSLRSSHRCVSWTMSLDTYALR